MDVELTIKW